MLLLLAGLATSCPGAVSAACSFPDYVQNSPDDSDEYWHFHALNSGDAVKVTFVQSVMTMTSEKRTLRDNNAMSASCENRRNDTLLLVANTGSLRFCIHLRLLTPNLVEFSTGKPHDYGDGFVCTGEDHVRLDMPLIANRCRGNTVNVCPLGGTYTFQECHLHDSSPGGDKGDCVCATSAPPSLLEIGSRVGEGIRLTFANTTCVPNGSAWRRVMTFRCLGSWTPRGSDDVMVLLGEDPVRPSWCMTYPGVHGDKFTLRLYDGPVCSATHTNVSFVELQLQRMYPPRPTSRGSGSDIAASRDVSSPTEIPSTGPRTVRSRRRTATIAVSSLASLLCLSTLLYTLRLLRRSKKHPYRVLIFSKLAEL